MKDNIANILLLCSLLAPIVSTFSTNSSVPSREKQADKHLFDGHLAAFIKKEVLSDDTQSKLKALREFSQVSRCIRNCPPIQMK